MDKLPNIDKLLETLAFSGLRLVFLSGGLVFLLLLAILIFRRKRARNLKKTPFVTKWREIQSLCRTETNWPKALEEADKLLDKALKRRKFKGKSMGVRLVAASKIFADNDDVWDAHNLVKKLKSNASNITIKQNDVKEALVSFREALSDLGALPRVKKR